MTMLVQSGERERASEHGEHSLVFYPPLPLKGQFRFFSQDV